VDIATGTSKDCQPNGTPDECDIAACTTTSLKFPGCDDCNLNGVPDVCDTAIVFNCNTYTGDCDPQNVGNPGCWLKGFVPGMTSSVSLGTPSAALAAAQIEDATTASAIAADVFVDMEWAIASLRMFEDATLRVTKPLLGNLRVVAGGGIKNFGKLYVAKDRFIDVPIGPLVMEGAAVYKKDPLASDASSGRIRSLGFRMLRRTIGDFPSSQSWNSAIR